MAVSNGITSLELFRHLADLPSIDFLATDLFNRAYVVGPLRGGWRVVFDSLRKPTQFIGHSMVLSAFQRERKRYPINIVLQRLLARLVLPDAQEALARADPSLVRTLPLIHPECLALTRTDRRFRFGVHDITKPASPASDVVRLMSVLPAMPTDILPPILRAVGQSVANGGLLIMGAPQKGGDRVPTTIFRRTASRLVPIRDLTGEYVYKQMVSRTDLAA